MDGRQMKGQRLIIALFFCLFVAAATALFTVLPANTKTPAKQGEQSPSLPAVNTPPQTSPVLWRIKAPSTLNTPTRLPNGWLLTSPKGEVFLLTDEGSLRWQAAYSNCSWQASARIDNETVCAMTQKGELACFKTSTGELLWKRETNLFCVQPPVVSTLQSETVLILLSQEEGTLLCLRAKDGQTLWRSPATNRTDGPAICFGETVAYGNCDATVYLFSLTNGHLTGSIPLKDDEQVAGSLLRLPTGQLVVGTQAGTLVLLDPIQLTCLARVKLSDTETFATPALVDATRFMMSTPEGKLTYWQWGQAQFIPDGEIQLAPRFDETIVHEGVFWSIARHIIITFRLADRKALSRSSPGDNLQGLSPGPRGQCLLLADGELLCMKGF
jgi:outer membrane protein assembly factor BamB